MYILMLLEGGGRNLVSNELKTTPGFFPPQPANHFCLTQDNLVGVEEAGLNYPIYFSQNLVNAFIGFGQFTEFGT